MNGAGTHTAPDHSSDMGPSVITVNFGLKGRHIMMAFAGLASLVTTVGAAGWLVLPAKQTDLHRVETSLQELRKDLQSTQEATKSLTVAVDEMTKAVKLIRVNAAAPRPKAKPKGIFD
jgi:hypothetical protein